MPGKNDMEILKMSGKSSQRKGRDGEREIAGILQNAGYSDARVGVAVSYGCEPDVVCDSLPLHLEVKRTERLLLPQWIAQAERDAERFGDGAACVVFRQSRQPWRCVLRLDELLRLIVPPYL